MKINRPSYYELFKTFLLIGFTAFGGLAMTTHIRKHIVEKKEWMSGQSFDSGLALCQVIPGAIVMQLAAYIGLKIRGIRGAVVCFVAFSFPSFLVMFLLSVFYKHTKKMETVEIVLRGLRVIIVAIVANAAILFGRKNFLTLNNWIIALIAGFLFYIKMHPALVLIVASLSGLILLRKTNFPPEKSVRSKTFKAFLWFFGTVTVCAIALFFINKDLFTLATIMLRIDLFSFGGGLAAMPIMYHELVDIFGWFDHKTFMDGVILGQVTPGSIIIASSFFSYMHFGIKGSIIGTICVFTPSFLILVGIIPFFDRLKKYPQFNRVINGILCSFVGLLAVITYRFSTEIQWNLLYVLVALTALILLLRKVDVIWIILGGIAVSFII